MTSDSVLSLVDLTVRTQRGATLLDTVSLEVGPGEIVGLVGESGSGKSMLAMSIGKLLPAGCDAVGGRVMLAGRDMLAANARDLEAVRGTEVAYVFQEPMTALNPTMRIGRQMVDVIRRHAPVTDSDARSRARASLERVRIRDAAAVFNAWPHELSGGMRQRVLIAMAFSCKPRLIVADEPTTALDVTVQAQVLALLVDMAREQGTAVLLITHDMGVVRAVTGHVNVMYGGRIVERGRTAELLAAPAHPYTRALLACLPERAAPRSRLEALPVAAPSLSGCVFRSRCSQAFDACESAPALARVAGHLTEAACWLGPATIDAREPHEA